MSESSAGLQSVRSPERNFCGKNVGLIVNADKAKPMVFDRQDIHVDNKLLLEGEETENVESFTYLGSALTWDNSYAKEIKTSIAKGKGALSGFMKILKCKETSNRTKARIINACIFSVTRYLCETWTLRNLHLS